MSGDGYDDNYEFERYHIWLSIRTNKEFYYDLSVFGQEFLELYKKCGLNVFAHRLRPELDIDLSSLIQQRMDRTTTDDLMEEILRYVFRTIHNMWTSIQTTLVNDFPKFLGNRANFWTYLVHFINTHINVVHPDFTTKFLVSNACFIALFDSCLEAEQHNVTDHGKLLWVTMVLHFFGERFKEGNDAMLHLRLSTTPTSDVTRSKRKKNKKLSKL